MTMPSAPRLDQRRTEDFVTELLDRAHAWIPSWSVGDDEPDFGRTLIEIAARFSSEVAERLDGVGDKIRAGFLDWLAIAGEAARPARVPVVFKLVDNAPAPILAPSPVRMKADAGDRPVIFETETDVQLTPGTLDMVVGVDADQDAYYLPPPGIDDLNPIEPLPTQWHLKSFAAADSNKLQLDPDAGVVVGMIVELAGSQYKVVQVEGDIVTIDPPLSQSVETEIINKVSSFAPFDGAAHNWQEHALYLGDLDLLNIEAAASIEVSNAKNLVTNFRWEYWGKARGNDLVGWQLLTVASDDEQKTVPGLLLKKAKGSIEPTVIDGKNSRWIRAYLQKSKGSEPQLSAQKLTLKINCATLPDCPSVNPIESPPSDAMANTTPLVLSGPFYPLGREPRQFDAFYLGNNESFSKVSAKVQLCFEMADLTFKALSLVPPISGANWGSVLAGIGADRTLHLFSFNRSNRSLAKFRDRDQLQPPSPKYLAGQQQGNPVALDSKPAWRLPIWPDGIDFIVAMTAGLDVWFWRETHTITQSGWESFGKLSTDLRSDKSADALVYLGSAAPALLVALYEGKLIVSEVVRGPAWNEVATDDGVAAVVLKALVPIFEETAPGVWSTDQVSELVGVGNDYLLYKVAPNGHCTPLGPNNVSCDVRPVAVKRLGGEEIVAFTERDLHKIATYHSVNGVGAVVLPPDESVLGFDVSLAADVNFVASVGKPGADYLASWLPPDALGNIDVFRSPIPAGVGDAGGAPTAISGFVIVPGQHSDAFLASIDFAQRLQIKANVNAGLVASGSPPGLQPNDTVTVDSAPFPTRLITESGTTKDNETLYPLDNPFATGTSGAIYGFRSSGAPRTGDLKHVGRTLKLDAADNETVKGALLLIESDVYRVTAFPPNRIVTLDHAPAADNPAARYWNSVPIVGRLAPFLRLDSSNNSWNAAILDQTSMVFSGADPSSQKAKAFSVASGNQPIIVVLNDDWKAAPPGPPPVPIVIDGAVGSWSHLLGDTSTNPELSWEYWNGKGWWKLDITSDKTQNFKSTGAIQFKVPTDIASSDWSGKTNFWIRARLVGGDYGQAKVIVTTTPVGSQGATQQTVDRSLDDIHAPSVVSLRIFYTICEPALPTYVLTQDSGSMRDQSDANQTGGAIVEAFVPIGVTLGRLSAALPASTATPDCPPACDCSPTSTTSVGNTSSSAIANVSPAAAGRAVLLGLTKPPSGAPVNILLVVDQERKHDAFAPMKIEALVGDRFIPIVTKDATRALGETGVLSLAFALEPTTRELFGKDRCWIRLTPGVSAVGEWKPALRGTYLNGVWASATETLTRELVGSSEGAPNLTLYLARPPLLRNTLELRVKEPLSDEERNALLNQDKNLVNSVVQDLPGDWVLWKQVIDPADESPAARVYALDESLGEIRFGDGQHGMIPPIGTDSIVAFKYQRTEANPDNNDLVPGNAIASRTQLNLVSPVPTVESVLSADQAAGGAPPESVNRVVRFGSARLRHRERVISAQDLEEIALESSPKIVQAHCRARASGVRLIVVMQGDNPAPSAAETRELTRFLLAAASLPLAGADVLRIEPPKVRRLRLALQLRIDDLDNTGEIANLAADKLKALFDTATGAVTKDGWPLGLNPTETEIAVALIDTPHLQSIEKIQLIESLDEHTEGPWPTSLLPNELVMLAKDPVRIEFAVPEVVA